MVKLKLTFFLSVLLVVMSATLSPAYALRPVPPNLRGIESVRHTLVTECVESGRCEEAVALTGPSEPWIAETAGSVWPLFQPFHHMCEVDWYKLTVFSTGQVLWQAHADSNAGGNSLGIHGLTITGGTHGNIGGFPVFGVPPYQIVATISMRPVLRSLVQGPHLLIGHNG